MKNNANINNLNCDKDWSVNIICQSHLEHWLFEYFEGLSVKHTCNGSTQIKGSLKDIASVYGIIVALRDFGITFNYLKIEKIS
ncbi:UNVERIFIED_CONTAM: hypothetical protein Cloal_4268 [Acetivibrio alkalicellulosi]